MHLTDTIYKLKGKLMHYAWGGDHFIPEFLGIPNPTHQPFAEYWMGAHPLASSELITPEGPVSLNALIREEPVRILSQKVFDQFGELPYLFKVQDVKDILSIQVHPSKTEAEKGYDREEAAGIPLNATYRNYKDRNHKPEMLVALSEFWLLHGFRQKAAIEKILDDTHEFNILLPFFKREGLQALYQFVMEMAQPEVNALLTNLVKREKRRMNDGELTKEMPGWWVAKLFAGKDELGDIDRAVFSIYFFNIVQLQPGEGLFQGAGMPHAYMEGQCVELMANSDNVLRAGLTPKHIDVPELMKHTLFEGVLPAIMKGTTVLPGEKVYPCPVKDFGIAKIDLTETVSYSNQANSFEIIVVTSGGALVNNTLVVKRGEAIAILPGAKYSIEASGHCTLFKAFVPGL
jgi:mannose-6-phosphate isomerase